MLNPFTNIGCPVTGERLVGREEIVDDIYQSLIDHSNYSIAGLHRIGKTSIGKEVFARIRRNHPDIRLASVTIGAIDTEFDLYQAILDHLFPGAELPLSSKEDPWRDFNNLLRKNVGNVQSIVMIDELDEIHKIEKSHRLINRLRCLLYDYKEDYHITMLFISARTLLSIQKKCPGSNLPGICFTRTIRPFSTVEPIREMLLRCGSCYNRDRNSDLCEAVYEITGGHPFLTEHLLSSAVNLAQKKQISIDEEVLQEALQQITNIFTDYYSVSLESFLGNGENGPWKKLCEYVVGPRIEEPELTLYRSFLDYGLLRENPQSWGICMSEHLRYYMECMAREKPIWPKIGDIERALRQLIVDRMKKMYGDDWLHSAPKEDEFLETLFSEFKTAMIKEQKKLGIVRTQNILDYSPLGTLKNIILHNWKEYQVVFQDSQKIFVDNLDLICLLRNILAHNRSPEIIPSEKVNMADRACDMLLKQLVSSDNQ